MKHLFSFLLCVLTVGPCLAQKPAAEPSKDVLEFTNGDTLTGKLLNAVGDTISFHSDMAGDLSVPFSKVKELRTASAFVALRAGKQGKNQPIASGLVAVHEEQITVSPVDTTGLLQPETIPAKDVGFLVDAAEYAKDLDHHEGFKRGWTGSATAGFTLVRSTQSSTTFTGAMNFVRQIPTVAYLPKDHRTTFNLSETYGNNTAPVIPPTVPASPAVIVKTSIFHADAERDQYFSARFYALADLSFDHNFASGLQFQQIYGAGLGWTPVQTALQELDLKADAHYEKQQFIQTPPAPFQTDRIIFGSTFQENYRRTLPRKFVLTQWLNFLPAWNDFQAYSANAYIGVAMPIFKNLSANVSATDNYINNPALYFRANTVQFVTGMTYTFK